MTRFSGANTAAAAAAAAYNVVFILDCLPPPLSKVIETVHASLASTIGWSDADAVAKIRDS